MKYQAHIDGLRTLAVLPVVLYHFDVKAISGGFLGVDVFFVISGFLITSILLTQISSQTYSLLDFYKKRAIRILPALCVVFVFTLLMAELLMLPAEKKQVGESIAAASAFASNFYFWSQLDYFSPLAESQPLLHTWSLSVEEQFYIFFPPILFVICKYFKGRVLEIISLACIFSFAFSLYLTVDGGFSAFGFYLLPARAWELGLGSVLAIAIHKSLIIQKSNGLGSLMGLALIVAPYFLISSSDAFPGINALYSCVGASLIILFGSGGITGSILTSKPFVEIGKVSYSLYLWHWPLVVFWKLYSGGIISLPEKISLLLVSLLAAFLSTKFIERPFRGEKSKHWDKVAVTLTSAVCIIFTALLGLLLAHEKLNLRNVPEQARQLSNYVNYREFSDYKLQFRRDLCFITSTSKTNSFADYDKNICASTSNEKPNAVLLGDSHAAMFYGSLVENYPQYNWIQINASGCRPLLKAKGETRCTDMMNWFYSEKLLEESFDVILISARWREDDLTYLEATMNALSLNSSKTILLGPIVEYDTALPLLLARSVLLNKSLNLSDSVIKNKFTLNEKMKDMVPHLNSIYYDLNEIMCDDNMLCKYRTDPNSPIQFDYGHLTKQGADEIIRELKNEI
ncbi:acyltransferase family protein [Agaribacter marinus]|uniref:Acyltransferase n=1 Tax=Agaribacter marinus TaxID=1431249 RepID=A0AA37T601_9ALTE|nr:acyltransferase family protein [Agaribacter marinus]GLR72893.1 acyltransferase [Agaribacter marinus]